MYQEGVMGGGGDDWFNVILLTVTNGITVNITDGDEDIDIVGTGLQQAVAIHDENATYTITATQNGFTKTATSVVTDTTNGKLFERELKMAAIEVTFDDEFRSQSFTISDGTTTSSSQTFPASGNTVDIFVPDTGTWKITSTVSGETFESTGVNVTNLNNSYTDAIYVIPNGKTVTPVNDIQLWLACGNIKGKPYTKLEEVLADEITLIKLMSDSNAVDYLKRSTDWVGGICDDETAMKAIGAYDYAVTELMDDADWAEALGSSEYTDYILVNAVPTLTASTSDVIGSPNGQSGYEAWKAFDGDNSTLYASSGGVTSGYIGYVFPSNVEVLGFRIYEKDSSYASYMRDHQLVLEYSTDSGSTWNDVGTFDISAAEAITVLHRAATSIVSADRWRVRFIGGNYQSGSSGYAIQVTELGFLVRETGGVQSWLKAAGISKPYTTLDEVIADSETLATLVTDHNAVDYLVTAKGLIDGITSSAKAMRYIGYRNYCADTLLADADWAGAIVGSEYYESVIKNMIPTMTSDTTPSGKVTASASGYTDCEPYKAFNDYQYGWYLSGAGFVNQWIEYEFDTPTVINGIKAWDVSNSGSEGYSVVTLKGSNVDNDWDNADILISDYILKNHPSTANRIKQEGFANSTAYKYYRLICTSNTMTGQNSYGYKIRLYGHEDVDETKITVIGAVNSDIYYKSGNTDIPIDTLSGDRKAIDRTAFPTPAGVHRLYSTVAKEPDDSTKDYYKDVVINSDTVEIEMMPEDTFYWYGYGDSENLEDVTTANGWGTIASGYPLAAPTHNTNNIDVSAGNNYKGVALKSPKTDIDLFNYIIEKTFTAGSSGKYMMYITGDKSYGNQDYTVVSNPSATNGHAKIRSTFNPLISPRIPLGGAIVLTNAKIYGMYNTKHNAKANFFSAANDIVYYTVGGTDIVVAETNEIGEAVVDLSLIPSGVILKSSVAKDPDNVSNDYTKLYIPPLTERFYMMPDNALYWYGWVNEDLEEVTSDNGWTPYSGNTFARPKYSDNYITIKSNGSSSQSGISSKKPSKGRPRAFVQGVTASSNFYGYLYNRSGKSLNAGGLTNVQLDSSSLKLYSTDDINTDKYGVIQVSSSQEANIYGFWYDVHSNLANFFSAANDRVYYLDNGNPVYVAETNGAGEAWLDLSKIPNGVTLYSSVAKDPDNLSNPFGKTFTVGSDGKFYLMPDNALYWYGWIGDLEDAIASNGWTFSSYTLVAPKHDVNKLSFEKVSGNHASVGTTKSVNVTTKINTIVQNIQFASGEAGYLRIPTTKAISGSTSVPIGSGTSTNIQKFSWSVSGNSYIAVQSGDSRAMDMYALWYD